MLAQKGGRPERSDITMSYLRSRYGGAKRGARKARAMGDLASSISNVISSAGNVVSDPYLPEVTCLIGQLSALKRGSAPGDCAKTQSGLPGGVGLSDAVVPLRVYVYAKENPWVFPLAAFAILGLPFWVGYTLGKDKS